MCIIGNGGYYSLQTDCNPANPAKVSVFRDNVCKELLAEVSTTTLNTCGATPSGSANATCNAASPVAAPVDSSAPMTAPQSAAPMTAPAAAPGTSNTPVKKSSSAVSIASRAFVAMFCLATFVLC